MRHPRADGSDMSDLLVAGGQVLFPDMTVERADVLVDQDSGDVAAVDDPGALDGDDELDADGGLVMPGLVNAHTHHAMTLLRGYADDKPLDRWLREDIWPVEAELEPEDVRGLCARYDRRWEIENEYKQIKKFLPTHASTDYRVRAFSFVFGCLLYNVWRLTDYLLKLELGIPIRDKPLLTAGETIELLACILVPNG